MKIRIAISPDQIDCNELELECRLEGCLHYCRSALAILESMANSKRSVLFYRDYRELRGGHLKVSDYFKHLVCSEDYAPEIYLTPQSLARNPWDSCTSVKSRYNPTQADILFLAGYDWKALDSWPNIEDRIPVINLIQGFGHCNDGDDRKQFLSRKALRICVSHQVHDALLQTGLCNGPVITIENGIDIDEDTYVEVAKVPGTVLILGIKQRLLASQLEAALASAGVTVQCILNPIERDSFLDLVVRSDIIVALPNSREGFYLPALEAMKLKTCLICPDCIGNRSFCADYVTCLMPEPKVEALLGAVNLIVADKKLAHSLRQTAYDKASSYTIERERKQFVDALSRL